MVLVPSSQNPRGAARPLTAADFFELPEDGKHYQLIEGELLLSPSPTTWHQTLAGRLFLVLGVHVDRHRLGEVFFAPLDVTLGKRTVVEPDLLFVSEARRAIIEKQGVVGAPDLVVELLSPGTERLDRNRKLRLYAQAGVRHYWILDPEQKTLEALALSRGHYIVREALDANETFRPALFPGLKIDLARLFA